jgi:hypothetical protein
MTRAHGHPWRRRRAIRAIRDTVGGRRPSQSADHRRRAASQTAYLQDVAGKPSTADELRKLVALRDEGAISTADYEQAKAKVLA